MPHLVFLSNTLYFYFVCGEACGENNSHILWVGGDKTCLFQNEVGQNTQALLTARKNALMVAVMSECTISAIGVVGVAPKRLRSQWGESLRG